MGAGSGSSSSRIWYALTPQLNQILASSNAPPRPWPPTFARLYLFQLSCCFPPLTNFYSPADSIVKFFSFVLHYPSHCLRIRREPPRLPVSLTLPRSLAEYYNDRSAWTKDQLDNKPSRSLLSALFAVERSRSCLLAGGFLLRNHLQHDGKVRRHVLTSCNHEL